MKQVFCYLVFFCLVHHATAQENIFFKKEKSKYILIPRVPGQHQEKQEQLISPVSLYATSLQVKRSFSIYIPKPYIVNDSKEVLLYIIGLGSTILRSFYAYKLYYNYTGDYMYPTINYRQNTH